MMKSLILAVFMVAYSQSVVGGPSVAIVGHGIGTGFNLQLTPDIVVGITAKHVCLSSKIDYFWLSKDYDLCAFDKLPNLVPRQPYLMSKPYIPISIYTYMSYIHPYFDSGILGPFSQFTAPLNGKIFSVKTYLGTVTVLPGMSGSPIFFEQGPLVLGVATGTLAFPSPISGAYGSAISVFTLADLKEIIQHYRKRQKLDNDKAN